jgi:hypothetical protein
MHGDIITFFSHGRDEGRLDISGLIHGNARADENVDFSVRRAEWGPVTKVTAPGRNGK